jgi:uncharacterized spore protein YtfJ
MTDTMTEAKRQAEADAADERFGKLLKSVGGAASAKAVFGQPVEKDGTTIVPVARVRFGVGGGGGRGPGSKKESKKAGENGNSEQVGYGQGGGVQAGPLGFIELSGGKATYTRIADPARPMIIVLLAPLVMAISFGIAALAWMLVRSR